jgi:hypothetical protein
MKTSKNGAMVNVISKFISSIAILIYLRQNQKVT